MNDKIKRIAALGLISSPFIWLKPNVTSVILPAHAVTSSSPTEETSTEVEFIFTINGDIPDWSGGVFITINGNPLGLAPDNEISIDESIDLEGISTLSRRYSLVSGIYSWDINGSIVSNIMSAGELIVSINCASDSLRRRTLFDGQSSSSFDEEGFFGVSPEGRC